MSKENLQETNSLPFKVVFEGVGGENSNFAGIRTILSFKNEEEFESFMKESDYEDKVIATGVTDDEALELVKDTDPMAYVDAAFAQSVRPDGTLNLPLLEMHLSNAAFAINFNKKDRLKVKDVNPLKPGKPKLLEE